MTIVDKLAGANGGRLLLAEASPHGLIARIEFPHAARPRPGRPVMTGKTDLAAALPGRRAALKAGLAAGLAGLLIPALSACTPEDKPGHRDGCRR